MIPPAVQVTYCAARQVAVNCRDMGNRQTCILLLLFSDPTVSSDLNRTVGPIWHFRCAYCMHRVALLASLISTQQRHLSLPASLGWIQDVTFVHPTGKKISKPTLVKAQTRKLNIVLLNGAGGKTTSKKPHLRNKEINSKIRYIWKMFGALHCCQWATCYSGQQAQMCLCVGVQTLYGFPKERAVLMATLSTKNVLNVAVFKRTSVPSFRWLT